MKFTNKQRLEILDRVIERLENRKPCILDKYGLCRLIFEESKTQIRFNHTFQVFPELLKFRPDTNSYFFWFDKNDPIPRTPIAKAVREEIAKQPLDKIIEV